MLVPLIIACALFMENLDSSIVATALPAMARDMGVDPVALKLAFTSYLISIAVFTPVSGWVADRYGARQVFRAAILVFCAGSLACGFASSLEGFASARILQGLGGSMMMPVGRLVLLKSVERKDYLRSLAWLTIPGLIGPVLGPPVGGLITVTLDWRYIFWINLPIGLIGVYLVSRYIQDIREAPRKLDIPGFLLSGIGLASFVFGLAAAGIGLLPGWLTTTMTLAGAVLILVYVWHARRVAEPLIDLKILGNRSYRTAVFGGSFYRIGAGALPFLLPLQFQIGFGFNALQSGLLTLATALGAIAMKFSAPAILRRFGFRWVLLVNGLMSAIFLGIAILFTEATPFALIFFALLLGGFFRSLQFTALNALAFADLDNQRMSQATSLSGVTQQLSAALGVSAAATALDWSRAGRADEMLQASDFLPAFLAISAISLLSLVFFWRLSANAGEEVSGHRNPSRTDA